MKNNRIGERYIIHSYKHDGSIHRAWDEAVLLDECDDYLVFGNDRTKVIESDGRSWKTKEPAIMYFFKNNNILYIFLLSLLSNIIILHKNNISF